MKNRDDNKIEEIISRGVEEIIDCDKLKEKIKKGQQLRIKLGIDPTSPNIHIGRSIPLLKLRDFQQLGHQIILIIGDFTGVIGDTSDKDSERPMLTEKQISDNMEGYIDQARKIIDISKCEIYHNSEWLDKLSYREVCNQANIFSLNNFNSRDNIKRRLDDGKRVSLRELMYPLMQGYDSVAVRADVEVGGTDQKFNLLAGRELQRYYRQDPQDIIMNPIIEGLDGRKMSSSWGNSINLLDSPNDMYGKIMSLADNLIIKYFTFVTRIDLEKINEYDLSMKKGSNPKDIKMKLAYEMVNFYYSEQLANEAENFFIKTFSKKETPEEMPVLRPSQYDIVAVLLESGFSDSKTDARRLVESGAVRISGAVVSDIHHPVNTGDIIQKGKRFFVRIK